MTTHEYINSIEAHENGFTGKGVNGTLIRPISSFFLSLLISVVLVLDSGFSPHECLNTSRIKEEKDFVDRMSNYFLNSLSSFLKLIDDNNTYDGKTSQGSHGVGTLSLVAGSAPGIFFFVAYYRFIQT